MRCIIKTIEPMKTIHAYKNFSLLCLGAAMFMIASARADTYSWTNFQSDTPGVAQHVDPNLVNAWDMAASPNGIRRLISSGELNAPWGLALVENELLVGNFGD